jgi:hypothetical protein
MTSEESKTKDGQLQIRRHCLASGLLMAQRANCSLDSRVLYIRLGLFVGRTGGKTETTAATQ